jgi:hypothetical protein
MVSILGLMIVRSRHNKLMQRQSLRYKLYPKRGMPTCLCDKLLLLIDMSDASIFPSADYIRRIID